jgi:replicative DNA helicase
MESNSIKNYPLNDFQTTSHSADPQLNDALIGHGLICIREVLPNVAKCISRAYDGYDQSEIVGLATGFNELDQLLSGLHPGDLILLAGLPEVGKTTFALNIAENVGLESNIPVAIFSMDLDSTELAMRIVVSTGNLNRSNIETGKIEDKDWEDIALTFGRLCEAPIYIDEESGLSSNEISIRARQIQKQCGNLGLIIVDYLQLMPTNIGRHGESRTEGISETLRSLKVLAKEIGCTVVVISELTRSQAININCTIGSEILEPNFADVVLFLNRNEMYDPSSNDKDVAEIVVAKNRNGSLGCIRLTCSD